MGKKIIEKKIIYGTENKKTKESQAEMVTVKVMKKDGRIKMSRRSRNSKKSRKENRKIKRE